MQEHIERLVKTPRTISNSIRTSKQMFNHVDNRAVVQRAVKEVKTAGDLDSLTFEQLSFFESQRIRREVFGQCIKCWGDAIVIKDDESELIWEDIRAKFDTEKETKPPVLYELMTGKAGGEQDIIYPGLDSCLGITITKADNSEKKGTHLVQPYDEISLNKYLEQLEQLNTFFADGDDVQIACKNDSDIEGHKDNILELKAQDTSLIENADRAVEILTMLSSHDSKKKAIVKDTPDEAIKYNTRTIHVAS